LSVRRDKMWHSWQGDWLLFDKRGILYHFSNSFNKNSNVSNSNTQFHINTGGIAVHHPVITWLFGKLTVTADWARNFSFWVVRIVILMNNEKYLFPAAVIICISIYYIWVLKKFSCEICIITAFEIQKSHFRVISPPPTCHSSTKLSKYSPDMEVSIRDYVLKSADSAELTEKLQFWRLDLKDLFRPILDSSRATSMLADGNMLVTTLRCWCPIWAVSVAS